MKGDSARWTRFKLKQVLKNTEAFTGLFTGTRHLVSGVVFRSHLGAFGLNLATRGLFLHVSVPFSYLVLVLLLNYSRMLVNT